MGVALGYLAAQGRGRFGFHVGELIDFGTPIADDSGMTAFFLYHSALMERDHARIVLSDRAIALVQLYLIYPDELPVLERHGIAAIWDTDVDLFDVRRERVLSPV